VVTVRIDGTRPFSEVWVGGQPAMSDPAKYAKWYQADAVGTGGKYFDCNGTYIDGDYIARRVGGHRDDPIVPPRPDRS
jgi:hypothetical protein